jgi:hypothetical protein
VEGKYGTYNLVEHYFLEGMRWCIENRPPLSAEMKES